MFIIGTNLRIRRNSSDDTVNFSMYMGEGKEPMFTILYKRKK